MESLAAAAFADGDWDSFNRSLFSIEELDFPHQILHQLSFSMEHDDGEGGMSFMNRSTFCSNPEANISIAGANAFDSNFHCSSQESCQISNSTSSNQIAVTNDVTIEDLSTDCLGKLGAAASHPAANVVLANGLLLKRKFDVLGFQAESDKFNSSSSENSKKRPRVSKNTPTNVCKNVQNSKKNRQINFNGDEGESNIGSDGQSSNTSCSSEVDDVSQDINGVAATDSKASQALNLNGKTRGIKDSATDHQSLYARKRREKINQRLRILQNLVPNGTKVDISTMIEEAVHYVKFLQLQIKLLSSDDLWMYAPIAYNGIDIGLST